MRPSRRQVLAAIPALALAGCGSAPLRIAVVWSSAELRRFQGLLHADRQPATVFSAGDNIAALLRGPSARVWPDVAMIPRLGLLRDPEIGRRLRPVTSADPPFWRRLATRQDGQVVGSWFKIAHKSLVWHRGALEQPSDWESWVAALKRTAEDHPPLSIGAADGWMLTDWFENHLLGHAPETYDRLFSHGDWTATPVRNSLEALADLWRTPGLFPGGGRRALTQQFHDSVLDVFRYGNADAVAAPDFAWPVVKQYGIHPETAALFRFPGATAKPLVVSGDLAVAMTADGARFVTWLAGDGPRGQMERWAADGGYLAPNLHASLVPPLLRGAAEELLDVSGAAYDLSDRLTGRLAGGDGRGLWRVLTRLFSAVSVDGVPTSDAVAAAVADLSGNAGDGRAR